MNTPLTIAFFVQWVCLIGLGVVVLALARQIGVLHQRLGPAGALMLSKSVKVGEKSPEFNLKTVDGQNVVIGAQDERSTLVMFVSPDCPVCAQLIPVVKTMARQEAPWLRVVFASDGGSATTHQKFRRDKGLGDLPYVLSPELGMSYQIGKLPYAVLLDETGVIASQGLCNSREHLESLFEAKRLGIASIQDYLAHEPLAHSH